MINPTNTSPFFIEIPGNHSQKNETPHPPAKSENSHYSRSSLDVINSNECAIIKGSLHKIFLIQIDDNTYFEKISFDDRFDLKHEYDVLKALGQSPELDGWMTTAIKRQPLNRDPSCNFFSMWTKAYPAGSLAHIITKFTRSITHDNNYNYSEYETLDPNLKLPSMPFESSSFYLANAALLLDKIHKVGYSWGNIKAESLLVDQNGYLSASNFVLSDVLTKEKEQIDWFMLGKRVAEFGLRIPEQVLEGRFRKISNLEDFKKEMLPDFNWQKLANRELNAPYLTFVNQLTSEHFTKLVYVIPAGGEARNEYVRSGVNGTVSLLTIGHKLFAEKLLWRDDRSLKHEFDIAQMLDTKDWMKGYFARALTRNRKFRRIENSSSYLSKYDSMLMEAYPNKSLANTINKFTNGQVNHLRGEEYLSFDGPNKTYQYSEYEICNQKAHAQLPIMPIQALQFYLANAAVVLDRLHRAGVAWRDTKAENFLVDQNGYLVAADFGISELFAELPEQERGNLSTTDWQDLGRRIGFHAFRLGENRRNSENSLAIDTITILTKGQVTNLEEFKNLKFFEDFDWEALLSRTMPAPRF